MSTMKIIVCVQTLSGCKDWQIIYMYHLFHSKPDTNKIEPVLALSHIQWPYFVYR